MWGKHFAISSYTIFTLPLFFARQGLGHGLTFLILIHRLQSMLSQRLQGYLNPTVKSRSLVSAMFNSFSRLFDNRVTLNAILTVLLACFISALC